MREHPRALYLLKTQTTHKSILGDQPRSKLQSAIQLCIDGRVTRRKQGRTEARGRATAQADELIECVEHVIDRAGAEVYKRICYHTDEHQVHYLPALRRSELRCIQQ